MADPIHPIPTPGSQWRHTNGGLYVVLGVSNLDNPRDDHPPDVIYYTAGQYTATRLWSRRLSDWHRAMVKVDCGP